MRSTSAVLVTSPSTMQPSAAYSRRSTRGSSAEDNVERLEPDAEGTNRDQNVVNLADQGYDVILAIGFAFSPGIDTIAADYPDQFFAVVDGFAAEAPNVANLTFKEHEGSFLVGAAAGLKTESGTVGFLGGQQGTGLIERFEAGYAAGVAEVNPDTEVLVEYIGDSTKAFNDPTKGEALSAKMYDGGADIVYHAAGASGTGLFKRLGRREQAGDRSRLRPVADGIACAAEADPDVDAEAGRHRYVRRHRSR